MSTRPVLFIGDSHTKGQLGGSFVTALEELLHRDDLQLLPYGVNGETTESIAKRVQPLLRKHPNPAAVFILPGSNDCLAREHPALQKVYNFYFQLSRPCTLESSLDNVKSMIERINQDAPQAKVIVITIPPHSEQPGQPAHQRVEHYNNVLKQMLNSEYPAVQVVDFYTAFVQYLQQHHPAYQQYKALEPESKPLKLKRSLHDMLIYPWYPYSLLSMVRDQMGSAVLHSCFGMSWNSISKRRGLYLLTDQVHMNDTAVTILAELLLPIVREL